MNLFVNPDQGRPRALWRLLFQFGVSLIGQILLTTVAVLVFALSAETRGANNLAGIARTPSFLVISGIASLIAVTASVWLAGRVMDGRTFKDFGLRLDRDWWLDLGFGLLLGAVLMTGVFLVELSAGWVAVTGTLVATGGGSFLPAIFAPVVFFLCVGFYEELASRGYQLTNMAEGLNLPAVGPKIAVLLAWGLSSLLFGVLHLANPNSTAVSTINIACAGVMLGTGYVLTGRLAVPIGLHVTWNFFQGAVFGFPVSGIDTIGATFVRAKQLGPDLLTGGDFGPEAGLLGLGAMAAGVLLTVAYHRLRYGEVGIQASLAGAAKRPGGRESGVGNRESSL